MATDRPIPIIDLFAGPGGLGEGFCRLRDSAGRRIFRIALSIEMDSFAHRTLRLRSFFRQFEDGSVPGDYYRYLRGEDDLTTQEALFERFSRQASQASSESWKATLGEERPSNVSDRILDALRGNRRDAPWVIIGGPPCQAYSLAGRSRMIGAIGRDAFYEDKRHTLYVEYLRLIRDHAPPIFVMENVRGLLSSRLHGRFILDKILKDLRRPRVGLHYRLAALGTEQEPGTLDLGVEPRALDFLIRSELHGVPQRRHRLIIVGIRTDLAATRGTPEPLLASSQRSSCRSVISDLPRLRSSLPRTRDSAGGWRNYVKATSSARWLRELRRSGNDDVADAVLSAARRAVVPRAGTGAPFVRGQFSPCLAPEWYVDDRLEGICNHESRSHIESDLHRYLFAASFAQTRGCSPVIRDFPSSLLPAHANIDLAVASRMFNDRFRVQLWDAPSTTITSHISKDGHYFIHPDPAQVRSLTVREAARLQTFPDNYYFEGPRTEQYRQVGNAVPPLLSYQLARTLAAFVGANPHSSEFLSPDIVSSFAD